MLQRKVDCTANSGKKEKKKKGGRRKYTSTGCTLAVAVLGHRSESPGSLVSWNGFYFANVCARKCAATDRPPKCRSQALWIFVMSFFFTHGGSVVR